MASPCLDEKALVELADGRLVAADRSRARAHVESCSDCRDLLVAVLRTTSGMPAAPDGAPLQPSSQVGRYQILEILGWGAMGVVYAARDPQLDRKVALKLLRADLSRATNDLAERLEREAKAMARLSHPNVVTVFDAGTLGAQVFIVMELVQGETLGSWMHRQERRYGEVVEMFSYAGRGLAAAHAAGLVHRDFKPTNVLIGENGRVRVTDFGLARLVEESGGELGAPAAGELALGSRTLTTTGAVVGTPAYMAPEQLAGRELDARADQFSFCVSLYEALYRERPFPAFTLEDLERRIERGEIAEPPKGSGVPRWLRQAVVRGLQASPDARYPSMEALLQALRRPRRLRWLLLPAAAAVGAAVWMSAGRPLHPTGGPPAVAVLGFKNTSGRPESAWLATALSEMLTTELAAGDQLRAKAGEDIARAKRELQLSDADSFSPDTLSRVRRNLNVDLVVLGSYVAVGDQLRLDVRLQETASGATLLSRSEEGNARDLFALVSHAGGDLRRKLGVAQVSASQAAGVRATLPADPEAARLYAEGLDRLRNFDTLGARDLLEKAIASAPQHAQAHAALASAWATLGYDERARVEARRAFELSQGLPDEQRLLVEGAYRETTHELDRAEAIYRSLVAAAPQNLEYGLRLAGLLLRAAKPNDALATVETLRKLPAPARDDPRIDIIEAKAADRLADWTRERDAAARAAQKGSAQGARLVVALARLLQAAALEFLDHVDEATAYYNEAMDLYRAAGDRGGVAKVLIYIGSGKEGRGDRSSMKAFEDALAIYREIGDRVGTMAALIDLAVDVSNDGQLARARALLLEAQPIAVEIGDQVNQAMVLLHLGEARFAEGAPAEGRKYLQQALALHRKMDSKQNVVFELMYLGRLELAVGNLPEAQRLIDESLALCKGNEEPLAQYARAIQAAIDYARDDLDKAEQIHRELLALREKTGEASGAATSRRMLANIALDRGRLDEAEPLARAAVAEFVKEHDTDEALARLTLGRLLQRRGKSEEAAAEARAAAARAAEGEDVAARLTATFEGALLVEKPDGKAVAAAVEQARKSGLVQMELLGRVVQARLAHSPSALKAAQRAARERGYLHIAARF